jgi:hypothetical protein
VTSTCGADEDRYVEGLGFQDAWKGAGMEYSQKFTWDSIDHTKQEGGSYNRYHDTSYPFKYRFDRVYFKQGANEMLSVKHIGNKPLPNNKHYLSDHFGMNDYGPKEAFGGVGRCVLRWKCDY